MAVDIDGGAPMLLDGNITLCARADLNSSRFFDGALQMLLSYRCASPSAVLAHTQGQRTSDIKHVTRVPCRTLPLSPDGDCAGRLAGLSVFDAALGQAGVVQLYNQGIAGIIGVTGVGEPMSFSCRRLRFSALTLQLYPVKVCLCQVLPWDAQSHACNC